MIFLRTSCFQKGHTTVSVMYIHIPPYVVLMLLVGGVYVVILVAFVSYLFSCLRDVGTVIAVDDVTCCCYYYCICYCVLVVLAVEYMMMAASLLV